MQTNIQVFQEALQIERAVLVVIITVRTPSDSDMVANLFVVSYSDKWDVLMMLSFDNSHNKSRILKLIPQVGSGIRTVRVPG
jgi:hypothetical protein